MAYLTINADDFGMTEGVTRGIHEAITKGIVTSTSAMACVPGAEANLRLFLASTTGTIGAHLQLTDGRPVLPPEEVPSLVDGDGRFFSKTALPWTMNADEVLREWKAQLARLRQLGIEPAYLDTHHHVHLRTQLLPLMAQLANELQLPVRGGLPATVKMLRYNGCSTPDCTLLDFFGPGLDAQKLESVLTAALQTYGNDAVLELSCHPGYSSPGLEALSKYAVERESELSVFIQSDVREMIDKLGLHLIGMDAVATLRPARPGKKIPV